MTFNEHLESFAGQPVVDWEPGTEPGDPPAIPRISLPYDAAGRGERWKQRFDAFLDTPVAQHVSGLVVGTWDSSGSSEDTSEMVIRSLVAARDRLPRLRALFLGDIIMEECEVSWIRQCDISALYQAYPDLEHLGVRGGTELSLGELKHPRLVSLTVQSGGLPAEVVRQVASAELPALQRLELWLGTQEYGRDGSVEDLAPILSGNLFPRLTYLGLRNSDQADDIAAAVAQAPLTGRIRVLDLSLGTLGDDGAAALLAGTAVRGLERLDIHHHYCSPATVSRLEQLGIDLDAGDPREPDEYKGELYRYVSVGE